MTMPSDNVLHQFESGRKFVRVSINLFRGKVLLDVREWVDSRDHPGTLIPTKSGVSILSDDLDELEAGLAAARKALKPSRRRDAA